MCALAQLKCNIKYFLASHFPHKKVVYVNSWNFTISVLKIQQIVTAYLYITKLIKLSDRLKKWWNLLFNNFKELYFIVSVVLWIINGILYL